MREKVALKKGKMSTYGWERDSPMDSVSQEKGRIVGYSRLVNVSTSRVSCGKRPKISDSATLLRLSLNASQ